jgi:large subunit ribosomal protein L17
LGDNADMAMIELVDYNELYNADRPKKKTTRRGRSKKTDATTTPVVEAPAANEEE